MQVDLHKFSSNSCDLHALGFIKSLLQACLCQHKQTSITYTYMYVNVLFA